MGINCCRAAEDDMFYAANVTKNAESLPPSRLQRRANPSIENPSDLSDVYDVKNILGQGRRSIVSKCLHKMTGDTYAVKAVAKPRVEKDLQAFRREIKIMKMMDHPNIIKLFEVIQERTHTYLIIELCHGSDLFERIVDVERLSEKQASTIMKQLFRGIAYMHQSRVCHRDLKIDHLMCSTNEPVEHMTLKITGFGLAWQFTTGIPFRGRRGFEIGTLHYAAPEMYSKEYTESVDMWSAGVILYVLLAGYLPFDLRTDKATLNEILAARYTLDPDHWDHVSEAAKSIVRSLLVLVPQSQRPTAEQLLQNEWVMADDHEHPTELLCGNFMDRFQNLRMKSSLKKAAINLIAYQMDEEQIGDLMKIFLTIDTDNSGNLTLKEIETALEKTTNSVADGLRDVFSDVNQDLRGQISINYTEFIAASLDSRMFMKEDVCWRAFCTFDTNGDGVITLDELKQAINNDAMEDNLGAGTVASIMEEIDTNCDGIIDFEEFLTMMRRSSPSGHVPPTDYYMATADESRLESDFGQ